MHERWLESIFSGLIVPTSLHKDGMFDRNMTQLSSHARCGNSGSLMSP
jgi:hypothetical protein